MLLRAERAAEARRAWVLGSDVGLLGRRGWSLGEAVGPFGDWIGQRREKRKVGREKRRNLEEVTGRARTRERESTQSKEANKRTNEQEGARGCQLDLRMCALGLPFARGPSFRLLDQAFSD